jgi:hypothetical protein
MTTNELAQVLKAVLQSQPHDSFGVPEWIALVAAIAAVAMAVIAGYALLHAKASAASARQSAAEAKTANGLAATANLLTEQIAKRAGVIELHQAWRGVNRFDPNTTKPIFPDAINAANALDLTSSLWNHDVLEKVILFQSYWKPFKDFYRVLSKCEIVMPDGRRVCDMISPTVTLTFKQMEEMELKGVAQTTLNQK